MAVTILIVEDELAIQELIALNLKRAGHMVLCADSAEQAKKMVNNVLPDLVLLDWMLPDMSGIEFARKLRREDRTKAIPIIMLTARIQESDKIAGLEAGADDYITKPFSPRELLARIKAVLRRRLPEMSDEIIEMGGLRLDPTTHRVHVYASNEPEKLSEIALGPTEFRLLHFLMAYKERVHTRSQLLDRVWGDHVFIEDRTVDVHIRRLRKILEAVDKENLVQTVRGTGYRFSVECNEESVE
ncbi:MAG: phosphate regulon transcriptional regulator PhoB [Nitrosomonas sp.]|jgi:two-component system phosphate regulon response regulator PhoB|uniref:phosphate regulon transcriptional regulator PhoB n=1 Tax=Nitrosomonas sp. TaxID=42353 RepID=UPI002717F8C1|nr:phosphate regulon transcriptional regulator PhoB [Nitrosomonas sp.]MBK6959364.1 phosphate regulon transcriptional regulator PhoB [Nitrosomonas sp.]MDO8894231.1 phosphate regulon transcriptional regulator PhoB [Nitrosomonas sp.]MDO9469473.1 phosphate regulon transcriptional regulator PhoB [Nitrosomonas sp.]MDP1786438.1 phosphate regulon transcriptional regulator PhoB [Nitrosomonas sp.]MDP2224911.1 phosphate regulon transcriptional regulator PhoB [Nitrosomonas sp.]